MKQKKQIKIIISLLVMIAVLMGGWGLMKQEGLSAKNKEETETKSVRAVPPPPNANIVNVSDNFTIAGEGATFYPEWTNTVAVTTGELQTGAVWYKDKLSLDKDFDGTFYIYLGDLGPNAADGMTFAIQNDPRGLEAVGGNGGLLGLYGGPTATGTYEAVKPAISVEFDLYHNGGYYDKEIDYNNGYGHVATVLSDTYQQKDGMPHYNVQYPTSALSNG